MKLATLLLCLTAISQTQAFATESTTEFMRHPDGHRHRRPISTCFAQDNYGIYYRTRGWNSFQTLQLQALAKCQSFSQKPGSCRILSCRFER